MPKCSVACVKCPLHKSARTVKMAGPSLSTSPKILIYIDHPNKEEDQRHKSGFSRGVKVVRMLLDRMSIPADQVTIEYTLKCFKTSQQLKKKDERIFCVKACEEYRLEEVRRLGPKAVVAMGPISCEAWFAGDQIKNREGVQWTHRVHSLKDVIEKVWVTYNPAIVYESSAETVGLYRVLFTAAEEIGLKPKHNPDTKPFDYEL